MSFKLKIDNKDYKEALRIVGALIGSEVECILAVEGGKAFIDSAKPEAWVRVRLNVTYVEGDGKLYTKLEYLNALNSKGEITLAYQDKDDHISATMEKSRAAVRILEESDGEIEQPELIKASAGIPSDRLKFATSATTFKPLLSTSAPNAIIEVEPKSLKVSAYDVYVGTHYKIHDEDILAKGVFKLTVEMNYWRKIVSLFTTNDQVKIGANDRRFRIKTENFDLYHAVIDEDTQDVGEVIANLKQQEIRAVIEFDGKDVMDAIDASKGIIRSGDKDGARFTVFVSKGLAVLATESTAGKMEAEFPITGYDKDEELTFTASSDSFSDTMRLTRDEGAKYSKVRLTVLRDYLIMESLKVPASSIAPVLQE